MFIYLEAKAGLGISAALISNSYEHKVLAQRLYDVMQPGKAYRPSVEWPDFTVKGAVAGITIRYSLSEVRRALALLIEWRKVRREYNRNGWFTYYTFIRIPEGETTDGKVTTPNG